MKLHLRVVESARTSYRVVTLRPGTQFFFSTNYYHDTWHILSDPRGAQLLARLMWGLSFQKRPGTIVLIDGPNIRPTPFGAERSNPILLMLSKPSTCDQKSLKFLRRRLKKRGSQKTVRWHTFGMDAALGTSSEDRSHDWVYHKSADKLFEQEQMFRRAGYVCYVAPPEIMRWNALIITGLGEHLYRGMNYTYLADRKHWPSGEVQVFDNYLERCSAAATARARTLGEEREYPDAESLYAVIACRRDGILRQRARNIRNRGSPPPRREVCLPTSKPIKPVSFPKIKRATVHLVRTQCALSHTDSVRSEHYAKHLNQLPNSPLPASRRLHYQAVEHIHFRKGIR